MSSATECVADSLRARTYRQVHAFMADLEELIDHVLAEQHQKLKERCHVHRIVAILRCKTSIVRNRSF